MSKEVFNGLQADILAVAKEANMLPLAQLSFVRMYDLLAKVSHNRAYDDNHPTYQSQPKFRVLPYDGRNYCWYYDGGLNDTHVETALKKIHASN